jgi:hypothetical protein
MKLLAERLGRAIPSHWWAMESGSRSELPEQLRHGATEQNDRHAVLLQDHRALHFRIDGKIQTGALEHD